MLPVGDMMPQSKKDLIATAYDAFNRRDIDSVLALMAPDVNWPNAVEGGRVIGHDQVRAYWTKQFGVSNPRVDPITIEPDESGRVAVRVHQVVRDLSGNVLADRFVEHLYSFKNDLIARMDIREPDACPEGSD